MLTPSQPFSTEALSEDLCVFRLSKAEHHEVGVIAMQGIPNPRKCNPLEPGRTEEVRPNSRLAASAGAWCIPRYVVCFQRGGGGPSGAARGGPPLLLPSM
jgi:hypothetical protein